MSTHAGICVTQSNQQHLNTDFTHVERLSLWTRQLHRGVALTIDLTGAPPWRSGTPVPVSECDPDADHTPDAGPALQLMRTLPLNPDPLLQSVSQDKRQVCRTLTL